MAAEPLTATLAGADRAGSSFDYSRAAWQVFWIALLIYVTTAGGNLTSTDALVTYDLTMNMVERRSLALSSSDIAVQARRGRDGRAYASLGIGESVYNIPFYLAGRTIQRRVGNRFGKPDSLTKAAVAMGTTVAAAACVAFVFLFAWRLSGSPWAALASAFALGFGTALWPYSKFGFNMPLAAAFLIAGTYLTWIGVRDERPRAVLGGSVMLGCALLTRHELILEAMPLALWLAIESWGAPRLLARRLALFATPIGLALMFWLLLNYVRFGHPLDSGQLIAGQRSVEMLQHPARNFAAPTLEGLYGLLVAPGTSLLLYSPIIIITVAALIGMRRAERSTMWLFIAQILTLVFFFSSLNSWWAGRSYGSRYLLPTLPFFCIPLAPWLVRAGGRARLVFAVVLAASVIVQLPGVLVDYSKVSVEFGNRSPTVSAKDRLYRWSAAPLVLNTLAAVRGVPRNVAYLTGREAFPAIDRSAGAGRRDFSQQFMFSLDFWWLYLFYLGGVPALVALVPPVTLLGLAGLLSRRLVRTIHIRPLR